ncbi:MAG: caa(3)-type oxidase subunit 4 [Desulfobacteraceae bacterium]|nr:MAG: caa(3)-type oxidase subunit 4 [Desulfobacteraceae bacterium]
MGHQPSQHIIEYKTLGLVFIALLAMTGVTIAASTIDLGKLNVWVALLIASVKGSLVLLYFMHMKYESRVLWLSFLTTVFFLAIMISFTFWDIAFR